MSANELSVTIGDRQSKTEISDAVTGDWCLFDAAQRMPRDETLYSCDVLERMLALKPNQSMQYAGETVNVVGHELSRFTRMGTATLPTDY